MVSREAATPAEATEPKTPTFTTGVDEAMTTGVSIPPAFYGLSSYAQPVPLAPRVSRRQAEQVPAVKRSHDLIAGPLATLPLTTINPSLEVDRNSWLMQPERDVPRSVTMSRLIGDLFYDEIAWWRITAFDWRGYPAEVVRLEPGTVDVLPDGQVEVTGDDHRGVAWRWPQDRELIRFDSPFRGMLSAGARAIRQCLLLDTAAQRYADGAPPGDFFTPGDGADPAEDDDIIAALDAWYLARKTRSTGYVPAALKYNPNPFNPEQLELAEQRQHAVLEIARVAGVDPEELGVSTTSRTYANQFDRRKAFVDFTLGGYRAAIEDRLSMGDVTPRGHRVRFDLDDFYRSDALTRYQAAEAGQRAGAVTQDETRAAEGKPPLTPEQKAEIKPAPAPPAQPAPERQEQPA